MGRVPVARTEAASVPAGASPAGTGPLSTGSGGDRACTGGGRQAAAGRGRIAPLQPSAPFLSAAQQFCRFCHSNGAGRSAGTFQDCGQLLGRAPAFPQGDQAAAAHQARPGRRWSFGEKDRCAGPAHSENPAARRSPLRRGTIVFSWRPGAESTRRQWPRRSLPGFRRRCAGRWGSAPARVAPQ